jgi:hypothetical protein
LIHLLLVVDVIGSHFVDKCIVGPSSAQLIKSFGLVGTKGFGGVAVEVAIVGVIGGATLEPVHIID